MSLRFDQVRFKASHNSYERDEQPIGRQLKFKAKDPATDGCRGLELDVHGASNLWLWSVAHIGGYDGAANLQFSEYLGHLRHWSGDGDHDVILLTIDVKTKPDDIRAFPAAFDAYLDEHLGAERIFAPGELLRGHATLVEGAMDGGWPTLDELRGRFVLCLSGNEDTKRAYARYPRHRLCFADKRFRRGDRRPSVKTGDRIFFNFNLTEDWDWASQLAWFATKPGFITRGYTLNTRSLWTDALDAQVNVLATDKVRRHPWATVGAEPFTALGG